MGEKIKEFVPLFAAAARGEVIQYLAENEVWVDTQEIDWTNPVNFYRVKPVPVYRPFTLEEMKANRDKWIVRKDTKAPIIRIAILCIEGVVCDTKEISYKELLKDYKFEDGTPCGVLEEEKK